MKRRYIIAGILLVIGVCGIFIGTNFRRDCVERVEKKLGIEMRKYVSVIEEQYNNEEGEEHVDIKMLIKQGQTEKVKDELIKSFSEEQSDMIELPYFHNTCPWWDMKEKNIVNRYCRMTSGKYVKTVTIWAFIVEKEEEQYLYISY